MIKRESEIDLSMGSPSDFPEEIYNSDADRQRAPCKGKSQSPQSTRATTPHALEAILSDLRADVHKIAEKVDRLEEEQAKRLADVKRMYERLSQLEKDLGPNALVQDDISLNAGLITDQGILDVPAPGSPPGFTSSTVPAPVEPQVNLSDH